MIQSEILNYIATRFTTNSEVAGVFMNPRQDALHGWNKMNFIRLWAALKQAEKDKQCTIYVGEGKEFGYVDIPTAGLSAENVFSQDEITACLRIVAEYHGDQPYRCLKRYFQTRNFIRAPHPLAGTPVLYAGEAAAKQNDGPILPEGFVLPEFEFYADGKTLSHEAHRQIAAAEAALGFRFDTHALKMDMGLRFLANYQSEILLSLKNYNYIVASRRSGKSLLAAYIAIRQTFIPHQTILYVMPSETMFFQPLQYINRLISGIKGKNSPFKLSFSDNILRNTVTESVVKMVSSKMMHGVRSYDAQMVILDEASFIADAEFLNLATIIEQKIDMDPHACLIAITTINRATVYNWFYRKVIEAELMPDDRSYVKRIPIFENPFYSERSRENLIKEYVNSGDLEGLNCELLAEFPPKTTQVPPSFFPIDLVTQPLLNIPNAVVHQPPPGKIQAIIICYDPAKKLSESAIGVIAVYEDNSRFRSVIIGAWTLPKDTSYLEQIQNYIPALVKGLTVLSDNIFLAFDENGVGAPLREIIVAAKIKNIPVHYYESRNGDSRIENGIIYLPKTKLFANLFLSAQRSTAVACHIHRLKLLMSANIDSQATLKSDIINALAVGYTAINHLFPGLLSDATIRTETADPKREAMYALLEKMRMGVVGNRSIGSARQGSERERRFGY